MSLGHPIEGTAGADGREWPPMGSIEDETRIIMDGSIKLEGEVWMGSPEASTLHVQEETTITFFRRLEKGK